MLNELKQIITCYDLSSDQLFELATWTTDQARKLVEEAPEVPVKAGREIVKILHTKGATTLQLEYVRCGKEKCRCTKGRGHGPYWYAYYRFGGKLKSEYVGKELKQRDAKGRREDSTTEEQPEALLERQANEEHTQ